MEMKKGKLFFIAVLLGALLQTELTGCMGKSETITKADNEKIFESERKEDEEEQQEREEHMETESEQQEEHSQIELEPESSIIDIKNYTDLLPEEMGGNLAQTISDLLHPEKPEITWNNNTLAYVVEEGKLEIGNSMNNDGYFVWLFEHVEGFLIYGIEPTMTETEAIDVLKQQNILCDEHGNYKIDENMYLRLEIKEGIVTEVVFSHYIG